jgi:hypothetical protein
MDRALREWPCRATTLQSRCDKATLAWVEKLKAGDGSRLKTRKVVADPNSAESCSI